MLIEMDGCAASTTAQKDNGDKNNNSIQKHYIFMYRLFSFSACFRFLIREVFILSTLMELSDCIQLNNGVCIHCSI